MSTATIQKIKKELKKELKQELMKELHQLRDEMRLFFPQENLNEALEDVSRGRVVGPFKTAKELMRSIKLKR